MLSIILMQSADLGNISVVYGPASNPTAFTALVLDAGDSWLKVVSAAGFGLTMTVTVTVSGQSALSTGTGLSYGVSQSSPTLFRESI